MIRVSLPLGVVTVWMFLTWSVVVVSLPSASVVVVVVVSRVRRTVAPFPFAVGSASVSVVVSVTGAGGSSLVCAMAATEKDPTRAVALTRKMRFIPKLLIKAPTLILCDFLCTPRSTDPP